jgi:hypothetical protein
LTDKIETESWKLSNLVDQVRKETETELLGAKGQLQSVTSEFETRTVQVSNETQILVEECRSEISEINKKLDQEVNGKLERQEENLNRVNAQIEALESKVAELPRPAVGVEPRTAPQILASPFVVQQSDLSNVIVSPDENHTLSCQTNNENVCVDKNVNACRMQVVDNTQASSYLSASELPLPLFNESRDNNNPVYHLRQLDDFMRFRGVPKALQLAVAYRSLVGVMSKQWVETACSNLTDYSEFKRAFLNIWWSASRQRLVKCNL